MLIQTPNSSERARARTSRALRWGIPVAVAAVVIPLIIVQLLIARAGPILKGRVVETLRARFGSDVELDSLQVTVTHGIDVTGGGLRILPQTSCGQPETTSR